MYEYVYMKAGLGLGSTVGVKGEAGEREAGGVSHVVGARSWCTKVVVDTRGGTGPGSAHVAPLEALLGLWDSEKQTGQRGRNGSRSITR